jgi:acylphosphatase
VARLNASVTGAVQDVGYRYFIVRRARERNLTGWVKNRADGTVVVEAVGDRTQLEEFLRFIRVGPPAAHIAGVDTRWFEDEPDYKNFDVRF